MTKTATTDIGPMAKCAHCGVLSVAEALACECGDCQIVDWRVPVTPKKPRPKQAESDNGAFR